LFPRLAEQYRNLVNDLVLSLQALAQCLRDQGHVATCYVCGDEWNHHGASFVADLGETHVVRFLVSDFGISWVESRDGHELVKLEGADAIQELHRVSLMLQASGGMQYPKASSGSREDSFAPTLSNASPLPD
jgi:hypothetical protein